MKSRTILAAATGTTGMTAFSALYSAYSGKNFVEPVILEKLLLRLSPKHKGLVTGLFGWGTHFVIGVGFAAVYSFLWKKKILNKSSIPQHLLLGAASGLAGVAAWKAFFESHPSPPSLDKSSYFQQLVVAHIIFELITAAVHNESENCPTNKTKVLAS